MPIKKSELYSSLWKSCDELRGGMDASQYKDYVLVLLFVKYVSDKAVSQKDYLLRVPKGARFSDLVALKGNKAIGEEMNKIISNLAAANDLKGVIDVADWNDSDKLGKGKEMVDRLSNLISIFDTPDLDFRGNRAEGDDLLGDAYEYLMRHFATESGKSKGQFYTPAEVSRIMAKVIGLDKANGPGQSIHDPTCGSGSLLLKAHDEARSATGLDLALYGQEMDNATTALARMNLILHDCITGEVWQDNTLSTPHFTDAKTGKLKTFDFVVANPPFSTKAWSNGFDPANDPYGRFSFGIPPKKNGDYAFLLHVLACLKSTGKGAVILPHGVLFRGNAEADIRREIVRRGYIQGIIGLPPNLFYGTGIPACILVLDKEHAAARRGIFMVDASKGFIKDGNKNRLRAQDIHKIVDVFTRQVEIPRFSRMVPLSEIRDPKNDFNLNLPRYIDSSEPEDIQDIDAHLRGGIPDRDLDALNRYWQVFPSVRTSLFKKAERPGYSQLKVSVADIKPTIFGHAEFFEWSAQVNRLFAKWQTRSATQLRGISKDDKPKKLIEELADDLLATFEKVPLLDAYDVYQHLMDYWAKTMQDDVYLLLSEGWCKAAKPRLMAEDKKSKERPDFVLGKQKFKAELIPPAMLVARYFTAEKAKIDVLESEAEAVSQTMEELIEENSGEDGLLEEVKNDKGKITKAAITARLKGIKDDREAEDEREMLDAYLALIEKEAAASAKAKAAQEALTEKIAAKYDKLSDEDVKVLVVDDKWLEAVGAEVKTEFERMAQTLAERVSELAVRYAAPLHQLASEAEVLAARVDAHLERMGRGIKPQAKVEQCEAPAAGAWVESTLGKHLRVPIRNGYSPVCPTETTGIWILSLSAVTEDGFDAAGVKPAPSGDGRVLENLLVPSDIVVSRSNTPERVGLAGLYQGEPAPCAYPDLMMRVRLSSSLLPEYLLAHLLSCRGRRFFAESARGSSSSMVKIDRAILESFPIPVPSLSEQRAIATVLSDVDALINSLGLLITKRRDIKQAVMQQLLTGQTRLPDLGGDGRM